MINLDTVRRDTGSVERLVHLNNCGASLPPDSVVDAVIQHLTRLYADDDKLEVGFQALAAAAETTVKAKSEALAASVVTVATSDAKHEMDAISLAVKALADIDRLYLMLLKLIADAKPHQATPEYVVEHSQEPIPVLQPQVRLLELHGLIADVNRLTFGVAGVIWELTDMGQLCLRLLEHERANKERRR